MDIGIIGLGHMGGAIARRLVDADHDVVVWDRTPERATEVEGARAVSDPLDVVRQVDLTFSVLTNDEAVREVVFGEDLLASLRRGGVFADLSTTTVDLAVELGDSARQIGVDLLDIEISGSTPVAESGALTLFVGGDENVLERIRPVLDVFAKTILFMGPRGSGAKMKLAVNVLLGVGMQALAEGIALGESLGLDRDRLLGGLGQTAVVAPAHAPKLENVRRGEYPVAFALGLMHKDFGLILAHAEDVGLDLPAAAASADVCAAVLEQVRDDVDFSAVARHMELEAAAGRATQRR